MAIPCGPKVNIELQSFTQTLDSMNASIETWATFATVLAVLAPKSGDEKFVDGKDTAYINAVAYIEYRSDVSPRQRVKYGTAIYNVLAVINPLSQGLFLKLLLQNAGDVPLV